MENIIYSGELQHHGTKGMRWGIRRYQNKDGTLTPAGKKRYDKEMEKLKVEEKKVKAEEKVAANRQKTQAKFDKLDAKKQALEERKKALKDGDDSKKKSDDTPEETLEERRAKALASTDPKEIYKNKDLLTYNELNERVNRIDLEARLQNKIPAEPHKPTVLDRVDATKNAIDKATNLYKSVDNAYSAVANSAIGKTLAKNLGIELPKNEKTFDLGDFYKNINKKSAAEIKEVSERLKNENSIMNEYNKRKNKEAADADYAKKIADEKAAAERTKAAKKAVDDYNKRWAKDGADDKVSNTDTTYSKTSDDLTDNKQATGRGSKSSRIGLESIERVTGTVEGKGTSTSNIKDRYDSGKDWWKTSSNSTETVWPDYDDYVNNNRSNINAIESRVAGYLEDKR